MTDIESALATDESYLELDRRRAVEDQNSRYRDWAITVACWDGVLPIVAVSLPSILNFLFPQNGMLKVWVIAIVPTAAFFVRAVIGSVRVDHGNYFRWQVYTFFLAIIYLVFLEAFFIAIECIPIPMNAADWVAFAGIYLIYFAMISIALFPLRRDPKFPSHDLTVVKHHVGN